MAKFERKHEASMTYCYCDHESAEFLVERTRKARKPHRCEACTVTILPGEQYEQVVAKCDGRIENFATCADCVALREYVTAHIPCFCWTYQELFDESREEMREHAHLVPGMAMESGRLLVAMRKRRREAWRARKYAA